jgi:hypothetical protein
VNAERIDVRREPLVVRDGCVPDRIPAGRWPADEALVRSEQFAVNEAVARLATSGYCDQENGRTGAAGDGDAGDGDAGDGDAGEETRATEMKGSPRCSACTHRRAPG